MLPDSKMASKVVVVPSSRTLALHRIFPDPPRNSLRRRTISLSDLYLGPRTSSRPGTLSSSITTSWSRSLDVSTSLPLAGGQTQPRSIALFLFSSHSDSFFAFCGPFVPTTHIYRTSFPVKSSRVRQSPDSARSGRKVQNRIASTVRADSGRSPLPLLLRRPLWSSPPPPLPLKPPTSPKRPILHPHLYLPFL